jgi:hypothetical protein
MDYKRREILDYNISNHAQFLNEFGIYHKTDLEDSN